MNLVYINSANGLSKAALETVTYAKKLGADVTVVTNGTASQDQLATLGAYGASVMLQDPSVDGLVVGLLQPHLAQRKGLVPGKVRAHASLVLCCTHCC